MLVDFGSKMKSVFADTAQEAAAKGAKAIVAKEKHAWPYGALHVSGEGFLIFVEKMFGEMSEGAFPTRC